MNNSIDKIIKSYFSVVAKKEFTYKNRLYVPKSYKVSPLILRGFTCPENCGACCNLHFTLDYLPEPLEKHPYKLASRIVNFNNKEFIIFSDFQNKSIHHCQNLNMINGRCMIHGLHPFSCDFELLRFFNYKSIHIPNVITSKLYGRGWNLNKCNNERGALCKMLPANNENKLEIIRKLNRLKMWCNYFELDNNIDDIINKVNSIEVQAEL